MPGGKRTDRISERDLEVLEFIGRYGVVPRDAVGVWAGTAKTATQTRERRLALAGLIEVANPWQGAGPFAVATRAGLGACLRDELPVAEISPSNLQHHAVCARLGARLERAGRQILSERELRAEERAWGKRVHSIQLRTRLHRPDLMILPAAAESERESDRSTSAVIHSESGSSASDLGRQGPSSSRTQGGRRGERTLVRERADRTEDTEMRSAPGVSKSIAVEVELTRKAQGRLEEIVRRWRAAVDEGRFQRVLYYCTSEVLPYVQRAVDRARAEEQVTAELIPDEDVLVTSLFG